MRSETEQKLNRIWYGDEPPPIGLRALAPLYRAAHALNRWLGSRRRPEDLEQAYIIVVGNLTAGGSGKTPLVVRLCRLLSQAGFRPGVVSRGYGRETRGLRLVGPGSDPREVGDEPLLIARRADVPVIVAADRCEAARRLLARGVDVVVADDGLQHYRLPRNLEICVVDGNRVFGNGQSLPAGPLREPPERLAAVDYIVVNGDPQVLQQPYEAVGMHMQAGVLRSLDNGQSWRLSQFAGCRVNAIAGIGNPDRFFDLLRQARIKVNPWPFPDHHDYAPADFEPMDPELPLLMTEKDAVKCRALGLNNAWALEVEAVLPADWEAALLRRVIEDNA
ncbi:MAG: tetraacyldisaccharide 4'-kinase [Xanthomonadales bacterium]